jgi:hypothetical protein
MEQTFHRSDRIMDNTPTGLISNGTDSHRSDGVKEQTPTGLMEQWNRLPQE